MDQLTAKYNAFTGNRTAMLAVCTAGIVGSLLVYGVLQERLMTRPFGEGEGEKFKYSVFIVLHNRLVSSLIAVVAILVRKSSWLPAAPAYAYLGVSASNVVATSCQYEALKYVSFPGQVRPAPPPPPPPSDATRGALLTHSLAHSLARSLTHSLDGGRADARQVLEDDPGDDLGHVHHGEAVQAQGALTHSLTRSLADWLTHSMTR